MKAHKHASAPPPHERQAARAAPCAGYGDAGALLQQEVAVYQAPFVRLGGETANALCAGRTHSQTAQRLHISREGLRLKVVTLMEI